MEIYRVETLIRENPEVGQQPEVGSSNRFRFQLSMLEKGADELQKTIGRIDEILFKIKASGVTVWVALIGWGFSTERPLLFPLGGVVILGFWLLEAFFRGIQARSLARNVDLTRFFNDSNALDESFRRRQIPSGLIYPLAFHETHAQKARMFGKGFIAPGVSILYLFLALINLLIWLGV